MSGDVVNEDMVDAGTRAANVAACIKVIRDELASDGWVPRRSGELQWLEEGRPERVFDSHYASSAGRVWVFDAGDRFWRREWKLPGVRRDEWTTPLDEIRELVGHGA